MTKIEGERFTLEQWRTLPDIHRCELIGGAAYRMGPVPKVNHQTLAGNLYFAIRSFAEDKACEPFVAPVDVFLPDGDSEDPNTVVQPDIMVVCDEDKVREDGIHGAPTFVAEVLSPLTTYKDMTQKKAVYERSGVKEYWLVCPDTGSVFRYVLKDGRYGPVTEILKGDTVESASLQGFRWKVELKERKKRN